MYKICSKCKKEKLFDQFSKDKNRKDGYSGQCKVCVKEYQQSNKDKIILKTKIYRELNQEKIEQYRKNYIDINKELLLVKQKLYRESNKEKISSYMQQYKCLYRKKSKDKINAQNAKRRADKLNATPKWLTGEDVIEIQKFYKEAQNLTLLTGEQHHVDHIIPLKGKNVCGLHVPWNLQVVVGLENLKKSNKLLEN